MMEVGVIAGPFESTISGGKYAKMYDYAPGMPKELNVAGPLYHLAPVFHLLRVLGLIRKNTTYLGDVLGYHPYAPWHALNIRPFFSTIQS